MTTRGMQQALTWARATVLDREAAAMTDAELLNAFLTSRAEAAFEAILRRHGPMIFGVCKRFLPEQHDAEDAFQAVFIVFARRASSIHPQSQLANWLYGVAIKTAKKMRSYLGRRRQREQCVAVVPDLAARTEKSWSEFWALLDQELFGLPSIYRGPIILCDLEGKSRRQAAHALGILEGTLSGRLARARRQLAMRLSRRGVSLSGAALAAALVGDGASAALPPGLAAATSSSVFALAGTGTAMSAGVALGISSVSQGVIRSMLIAKVWQSSALLAVTLVVAGGGIAALHGQDRVSPIAFPVGQERKPDEQARIKSILEQMKAESKQMQALDGKPAADNKAERIEALQGKLKAKKIEWERLWKDYLAGNGSVEPIIQASVELLNTELKLVDEGVTDRLAAFNSERIRAFDLYMLVKKRYGQGKVPTQALAQAQGAYESARAQIAHVIAPDLRVDQSNEIIAKLKSELLDTAKSEWDCRRMEYVEAGRGTQAFLFAASHRYKNAQLKLAQTSDERIAVYRANIDRLKHIEAVTEERFEAGKIATQDKQEARYSRIEAELELAQFLQQVAY